MKTNSMIWPFSERRPSPGVSPTETRFEQVNGSRRPGGPVERKARP